MAMEIVFVKLWKGENKKKDEENVSDILKTLERVTMELPKLVLNENGEYVAAE